MFRAGEVRSRRAEAGRQAPSRSRKPLSRRTILDQAEAAGDAYANVKHVYDEVIKLVSVSAPGKGDGVRGWQAEQESIHGIYR